MKNFSTVSEYIVSTDPVTQKKLKKIRALIKKVAPGAEEKISYGMPAYSWNQKKKDAKPLFYFACMKGHIGLYPTSGPIKTCAILLKKYSTSKGCVRLPHTETVPEKIIATLLKARMKEIAGEK